MPRPDPHAQAVLNGRTDYRFERSAHDSRGHILLPSVVCTPENAEVASSMVEGGLRMKSRQEFCRSLEVGDIIVAHEITYGHICQKKCAGYVGSVSLSNGKSAETAENA